MFWACNPDNGLSPRVRGNPPARPVSASPPRSIPACAGEPLRRPAPIPAPRVYPRVCGGTELKELLRAEAKGLSPRVRGNHD